MASLKTSLDSIVCEEMECTICLNRLDRPRMLSCLHSFCEKCLHKTAKSHKKGDVAETIQCALCRETTKMPPAGVTGLRLDFRAVKFVEALIETEQREQKLASSAHKCDVCQHGDSDGESPFKYCRECAQVLCMQCSSAHAGLRCSQNHTVASIADLLSGKVTLESKKQSIMCQKHSDERLKLFCITCFEPICHDCTLFDHCRDNRHEYTFLKDYIPKIQDELNARLKRIGQASERLVKFLAAIDKLEIGMDMRGQILSKEIQSAVSEHGKNLDQRQQLLAKEKDTFFKRRKKELLQLRQKTQTMKALADKSSVMTQEILKNEEDFVGIASMYTSLREAMDRSLAEKPDEATLKNTEKSITESQFHVTHNEAQLGRFVVCCEERQSVVVSCKCGPKCITFTQDGRVAVIVQVCGAEKEPSVLYSRSPSTHSHTCTYIQPFDGYYNCTKSVTCSERYHEYVTLSAYKSDTYTTIMHTVSSYPTTSCFERQFTIAYDFADVHSFAPLSDHRFVITMNNMLQVLVGTSSDISHNLPNDRSISGLTTDLMDNIYVADSQNKQVHILNPDGSLQKSVPTGDLSPTGIAVCPRDPNTIVITHDPAAVSVLDLTGNKLCAIRQSDWKKVAVACDDYKFIYLLWSDDNSRKYLLKYNMEGVQVDTIFEKENHTCSDLLHSVSSDGVVAVVTGNENNGSVLFLSTTKEFSGSTN